MKRATICLLALCILAALGSCASAENFLDTYLNNIKLDQSVRDWSEHVVLTPGKTVGQSFTTGPNVTEIYQIAISSPWHGDNWTPSTTLVMALYDSPQKGQKLAEFGMKYEWRAWEHGLTVFPMEVDAKPNTSYYFELRVEGDGARAPIAYGKPGYKGGEAYMDGKATEFDLVFEDYVHTTWDRDATYRKQFNKLNLDYPGLEKVKAAVEKSDWETAAKEMVAYFESRTDLVASKEEREKSRKEHYDPNADLTECEMAMNMSIADADGNIISLGPNWCHLRQWETRGGVGLTRSGIRNRLSWGYFQTGDEAYAKAWTDMMKAVLTDLPSPLKSGVIPPGTKEVSSGNQRGGIAGGSMWSGLAIGARMNHALAYYGTFVESPNFPWDVRAAFIMNLFDMADVLAIYKGHGNHNTLMKEGLFSFAQTFPELKRSDEFFALGWDGLIENMKDTLAPDGPIGESIGYQSIVHRRYTRLIKKARELNLNIPNELKRRIELADAFHLYTMQPDGTNAAFGDGGKQAYKDILLMAAKEFDRPDLLWGATDGKEGKEPEITSCQYPYSYYVVMRSDWTPDARFLVLRNGRYTGHPHYDSLGFSMFAYGNPIFQDPGVYIYGTPETMRLMATQSHSTVSVDDKNMHVDGGPNQFSASPNFDYLCGKGPAYQDLPGHIYTVRRIAFLKPDYWVFSDVVRGDGEHEIDSCFHYPGKVAKLDPDTEIATTTYTEGGNLAVIPVNQQKVEAQLVDGITTILGEGLQESYILKQTAKTQLPYRIDNVMYPYLGEKADAKVTELTATKGAGVETSGVKIETGNGTDYVVFASVPGEDVLFDTEKLNTAAQCAVVRRDKSNHVNGFSWIWGQRIYQGGLLAESDQLLSALDVDYDGKTVHITTNGTDSTLRIKANGATSYTVNGSEPKAIEAENGFFRPFSGEAESFVLMDNELPGFKEEAEYVGGTVGGSDQIGFSFLYGYSSPGRPSKVSYNPDLKEGKYEVSVFIPHIVREPGLTSEAHYMITFKNPGYWLPPEHEHVHFVDTLGAISGELEVWIDQASAAGKWVSLGEYEFTKDRAKIELSTDSMIRGPIVVADAMKFTPVKTEE